MRSIDKFVLATIFGTACGGDGERSDTTPDDTGSDDAATETAVPDITPDSVAETTPETAAETGDASGTGTVAGTALEGVAVTWRDPLELCTAWTEGAPLADEKARKVRLVIPPQGRPSLDEAALGMAHVDGLAWEKGPYAEERKHPTVTGSTVTAWQILQTGSGDHFAATISHHLSDGAGTLYESYAVSRRTAASAEPVVVTPESFEVSFAWAPESGALQATRLERCGGAPDLEDAVSVVVAESGKSWATLVRYWRTVVGGVDAGSYPVALVGHRIVTSDNSWWMNDAWGYWAATYVAQHHNWNDGTEVDFSRDLGAWHTFFRAPEAGVTRVRRVSLDGVLGGAAASMTIIRETDGAETSEVLPVPEPRAFTRVDANELGRQLATTCEDGKVLAAGYGEHLVQLMFCDDGKRALVGVVPVIWGSEPTRAGKRVDDIDAIQDGWKVTLGAFTLNVLQRDGGVIETSVLNDKQEVVTSSYEVPYLLSPPLAREEVVQGAKEEIGVSMRLVRRWAGFGVGKSQLWAPVSFSLTLAGVTREVSAWDRLDYTNTHHNWEDELTATADDGVVMHWKVSFMNGITNQVSVTGPGGEVLLAPVDLGR